ncbi:predicted acyltransferase [Roseobacter sp. SK209-2-6]|nr:predicted acyltransferase [Roseobacter sp. SK209-2-6]
MIEILFVKLIEVFVLFPTRLSVFDGLRALAVLAVVFFHYFQSYPKFYPYGDTLLPWASYGNLGVHLFFIISGFVIPISLLSGGGGARFLLKRFLRLWPALAVCSALTFLVMQVLSTDFALFARREITAFVPSLTFTRPEIWPGSFALDNYIDPVYWTLAIEAQFYLIIAALFAMLGRQRFCERGAFCLLLAQFSLSASESFLPGMMPKIYYRFLSSEYLHLFAAGMLFSQIYQEGVKTRSLALLLWSFAVSQYISEGLVQASVLAGIYLLVLACALRLRFVQWLGSWPLATLGLGSYSVYLLHNNIGNALISLFPPGAHSAVYLLCLAGIFALILLISACVYLWVEKPAQALARRWAKPKVASSPDPLTTQTS